MNEEVDVYEDDHMRVVYGPPAIEVTVYGDATNPAIYINDEGELVRSHEAWKNLQDHVNELWDTHRDSLYRETIMEMIDFLDVDQEADDEISRLINASFDDRPNDSL
jgi:hypothetical protein